MERCPKRLCCSKSLHGTCRVLPPTSLSLFLLPPFFFLFLVVSIFQFLLLWCFELDAFFDTSGRLQTNHERRKSLPPASHKISMHDGADVELKASHGPLASFQSTKTHKDLPGRQCVALHFSTLPPLSSTVPRFHCLPSPSFSLFVCDFLKFSVLLQGPITIGYCH